MSSTRSRNKFCLSLDNSCSSTSSSTSHLNRWSEVVPPKTALTFAALWDPEDGMVTFSGAELFESDSLSGRIPQPHAFDDDYSQFITLDCDTDGCVTADENTATLSTFQDVFTAFLRHAPLESRDNLNTKSGQRASRVMQTRASSTFDGLDVYTHDVQFKPRRSVQLSCIDLLDMESSFRAPSALGRLRLRSDLMLDSYRSESDSESCSGSRPAQLKSHFSTTTTSTSAFADVTTNVAPSVGISETLPVPEWTRSSKCISPAGSWPYLPRPRRVLRKRRPFDGDTTITATSSNSSAPRKLRPKHPRSPRSLVSSSPRSPSSFTRVFSSSSALAAGEERHGRFPLRIGGPASPTPTPPSSPSKSPRLNLRFAFLQKRKSHQPSDSDGWVCVEVTPFIRQRYIPNLDDD